MRLLRSRWLLAMTTVLITGCLVSAGCSPKWRAKFIRKRKTAAPVASPILVLQPDYKATLPAPDRYREHYAYWKSWHSGLLDSYGQLRKRDRVNLQGVLGEAEAMQALLTGEPSEHLRRLLLDLREIQDQWDRMPDSWQPPMSTRARLEQLFREINKNFHYAKVKQSLIQEPEREEPVAETTPAGR